MKNKFDKSVNRKNTYSVKWDTTKDGTIPMWVADMDYEVATPIIDSIHNRTLHKVFGYTLIPESFYDAEIYWWQKRHNFKIKKKWIEPTVGVIPSLSATVQAFCKEGDKVLIQSPVYNYFDTSIKNNKCDIVKNNLIYKNGKYSIDFEDFEKKVKDKRVKLFILCNPHNPVGRVWRFDELKKMGELCIKYNVVILSDEIHRDLVYKKYKYTPISSISKDILYQTITCTAPSKTFNIAGLKISNIIVANKKYRAKINKSLNINETIEPNIYGIEALISAYTKSEYWLDELLVYLEKNKDYATRFISNIKGLKVVPIEATYLLCVDCSKLGLDSTKLTKVLEQKGKIRVASGITYGKNGENFIRINIACSMDILKEGLKRVKDVVTKLDK
jgi:cystathionine beta-lyase